ncbi:MAG: GNAT family N-acetyltransferase [Candidatus Promineifilaceae bacterium]|nr:GNAT family N-acetyltransferase [Candidatus Promineifilaceae bacterium]
MPGPNVHIEPVGVGDLLTITRMAYANMTGADERFTELVQNPLGRLLGYLIFPFYFLFAGQGYKAVLAGRIVGAAYLHLRHRSGFVFNVNVNRQYRRQGIGRQLMNHLETVTRRSQRSWIALQVDRSNEAARAMYETLGYRAYHPEFMRRQAGGPLPKAPLTGVTVQALDGYEGRRLFERYQDLEQRQGDAWAAGVAADYQPELQGRVAHWRCRLHGSEIGAALSVVKGDHCQLRLALEPDYWGHLTLPGFVSQLVEQSAGTAEVLDVYLGSSAHHEAAEPLLERHGFEAHIQDRILMLKGLD